MAKRWLALILGILMAFPLSAWADGSAAMQIEASPHSARFTYTNSTQRRAADPDRQHAGRQGAGAL